MESEEERTSNAAERAKRERLNASVSQVVRKSDRSGKRICFSNGLPEDREGAYKCGHDKSKKQIRWEHDPHRLMVCDMKGFLDDVVDKRFGGATEPGAAQEEDKKLFKELVEVEKKLDRTGYTRTREPFRCRAGLRLIMMLVSILP